MMLPHSSGDPLRPRFRLIHFDDIRPDEGVSYLIKGLLSSTGLAIVWGAPKCGKSFWMLEAMMHVALGRAYRSHRVAAGPVVYCALEGAQGFKLRIEAFRQAKLGKGDSPAPPFYLMATPLGLVRDHKAFIDDIRRQLGDARPVAVCIDTLNRSLAGSENSDEDMARYIQAADVIRDAFGCVVVIVHHCGHNSERPRGHSSLMGALDVQIAVKRVANGNIVAEVELSKDGETGLQIVSRLKQVEIGVDGDGDPITSCIIEAVEARAAESRAPAKGGRSDEVESIKLALIDAYGRLADAVCPLPGVDGVPVRKVSIDKLRDEVRSRGMLETDDAGALTSNGRSHFRRAKTDLITAKRFIESEKLFWRLQPQERDLSERGAP
jgi:AAA domain